MVGEDIQLEFSKTPQGCPQPRGVFIGRDGVRP